MPDRDTQFLTLVTQHRALLCKVCRAYARTPADREDLHQEILVQVWRALPGFRGDAQPTTWLYRVALNTAISFQRKQRTRRSYMVDAEPLPDQWQATCPLPIDDLATREQLDRLYAAIDRLNAIEKAIILLALDDLPYRDIAAVTGLTENNVGVRVHRIKNKLATYLTEVSP